jgi:hypothetical protein
MCENVLPLESEAVGAAVRLSARSTLGADVSDFPGWWVYFEILSFAWLIMTSRHRGASSGDG